MPKPKVLHPPGTKVKFSFSWFARASRHNGHTCEVVESHIERHGTPPRNYHKYTLRDLTDGSVFKTENTPPTWTVTSLAQLRAWKKDWARDKKKSKQ